MSKATGPLASLYQSLVEHSDVGLIALKDLGRAFEVVYVNPFACELLEFREGEVLQVESMFPNSDRGGAFKALNSSLLRREGHTRDVMIQKFNQHLFLASVGIRRIELEDMTISLFSFRDLTIEKKLARDLHAKQFELERAYAELLEHNAQLKQLDQAKDRFIALMTHELRTPLSAVLATADVLELKLYESEAQHDEFVRTIGEQGRHLLTLVNDVLDFSKIRAGKMDFFVEQIDLNLLINRMIGNFDHMARAENIKIEYTLEVESAAAWADAIRMREILSNVLSNAIKYNRSGGFVRIRLFDFASSEGGKFKRISVRDSGVGIPSERLESVFNEFETVGHVSSHHKGTGLGMPISKRLIESMAGALTLESEPGVGTEFFIDVPVDRLLKEEFYRSRPDQEGDFAA